MKRRIFVILFIFLIARLPAQQTGTTGLLKPDKKKDSLLSLLKVQVQEDSNRINTLLQIAKHNIDEEHFNDILQYAEEALQLAEGNKKNYGKRAYCLYVMGVCYNLLSEYEKALEYIIRGLTIVKEDNNEKLEVKMNRSASQNLFFLERHPESISYGYKGLKLAEKIKDTIGMASCYQMLSAPFFEQDKFEEALSYNQKALAIYRQQGLLPLASQVSNSLGEAYTKLGRVEEALKCHREALQIIRGLGAQAQVYALAYTYSCFGAAYEKKGDQDAIAENRRTTDSIYNLSLKYYFLCLEEWKRIDSQRLFLMSSAVIGSMHISIGSVYYKLGQLTDSRQYLASGISISRNYNSKKILGDAYLLQSRLDSIAGNSAGSLRNFKLHIQYRDSVMNDENTRLIERYKNLDDFEKKEKDLQLKIAAGKLNLLQVQKKKQQLFFAWIIAAVLLTAALYGFYRYRRYTKIKAEQKLLQDRLAISRDLHDSIGSTLGSLSVYSQVAKIHGEKQDTQSLNELLEKMSGISNEAITAINDIIWAINPQNDTMEKMIQRMESFAKPLLSEKNIHFHFQYEEPIYSIRLGMEKRKNFYLLFKEAVGNVIRHSGASELTVDIVEKNNQLDLLMKDNGAGFSPGKEMTEQAASGNGLKNMYARAAALNGKLQIESQPGTGTTLSLSFPLL